MASERVSGWTNGHRLILDRVPKPEGDQHDDRTESLPLHALTEDNLAAVSPDLRARVKTLADGLTRTEAEALAVRFKTSSTASGSGAPTSTATGSSPSGTSE